MSLSCVTTSRNGWKLNGFPIGDPLARRRAHRNPPPSKAGHRWLSFLPVASYGLGNREKVEFTPASFPACSPCHRAGDGEEDLAVPVSACDPNRTHPCAAW